MKFASFRVNYPIIVPCAKSVIGVAWYNSCSAPLPVERACVVTFKLGLVFSF